MSGSMYELIAIAARYVFAALMVLIVIRAWKITIIDARRAAVLRRLSPETGVCGEFLIMSGGGRVRDGMRFPVIREGMIGSASKADVRLRAQGVHRAHAYFELTKKGLRVRTHANARLYNARGESKRELLLGDGAKITVGSIEMMLILTVAVDAPVENDREGLFDIPDDSPALSPRPVVRPVQPHVPQSHSDTEPEIPISRSAAQNDIFAPRPAYTRDTEARYRWRETYIDETTSRRTIVREAENVPPRTDASPDNMDDLFLERRPSSKNDPASIPGWDDPWSEPAKKPVVTKKHTDDPFDL